jgi:transcription antitermination factor NusG
VDTALQGKGYETLLPVYHARHRRGARDCDVELPLFPGYLFASFDPEKRLPVLTTPGLLHLVGFGKTPAPLDESEIDSIRRVAESRLDAEPCAFLPIGQRVMMQDGPLAGVEGILQQYKNKHQLILSVTLLQRSVAVEVRSDWVRPIAD